MFQLKCLVNEENKNKSESNICPKARKKEYNSKTVRPRTALINTGHVIISSVKHCTTLE